MKISIILFLPFLFLIPSTLQQKDPHYLYGRSVMVHMFEWKFDDIADECERFLAPRGYGGIQLSPITENVVVVTEGNKRPWWERYQPISYKFQTRSGDEKQLADMIRRCNNVGVRVFVDVLLNHMTANHNNQEVGTGGSRAHSFNKTYEAVPYGTNDFHETCPINNFDDRYQLWNCELVGLHDLDQSKEYVRDKLVEKLDRMVDLGVAGFRLDAAKHINKSDLEIIVSRVKNLNTNFNFPPNARPFIVQEVIDYGGQVVSKEEYLHIGTVTEFKFGRFLTDAFRGATPLKNLINFGTDWGLIKNEDGLVFVDNHDTQRDNDILTYKDSKAYKMAVAFMLSHPYPKLPRVMSSFDFQSRDQGPPQDENQNIVGPQINSDETCTNGWVCEHRWREIYNMVQFRMVVNNTELNNWWDNGDNQIAFCRGNKGFVAFNKEGDLNQNLQTCLPSGSYCDVISGSLVNGKCTGKVVTVDGNGMANIQMAGNDFDGVLALHVEARMEKSKI